MPFRDCRNASRANWGTQQQGSDDSLTIEQIQLGAVLRIADATEAMAKNHNEMIAEINWLKASRQNYIDLYRTEAKANRYLRAQITKLRNKLKKQAK